MDDICCYVKSLLSNFSLLLKTFYHVHEYILRIFRDVKVFVKPSHTHNKLFIDMTRGGEGCVNMN